MKVDLYLKIILTLIAFSLFGLLVQSFGVEEAEAQDGLAVVVNTDDIAQAIARAFDRLEPVVNISGTVSVEVENADDIGRAVARYAE